MYAGRDFAVAAGDKTSMPTLRIEVRPGAVRAAYASLRLITVAKSADKALSFKRE